jgi:hypothetical protein
MLLIRMDGNLLSLRKTLSSAVATGTKQLASEVSQTPADASRAPFCACPEPPGGKLVHGRGSKLLPATASKYFKPYFTRIGTLDYKVIDGFHGLRAHGLWPAALESMALQALRCPTSPKEGQTR